MSASVSVPQPLSLPFQLIAEGERSSAAAAELEGGCVSTAADWAVEMLCHRLLCGSRMRDRGGALCWKHRNPKRQQWLPKTGSSPLPCRIPAMF